MIDLKSLFKDFNHSKFTLFICLLPFTILLSLKLDGYITYSLWVIFVPLWLLKLLILSGALVGSIVWCRHAEYRHERDSYTDFKAMLMTVGMQLLLLMFELLLCDNVENGGGNMWIFIFMPLFFVSPVAVAASIWGFKHDRSLELEALLSVNILLFIFVALRLDNIIDWTWTAIFIPLWIVMCLPGIAVLYYLVWTLLFFRSTFPGADRRAHLSDAVLWIVVVIPVLTFEVLLAYRLDGINNLPWVNIFIPLYISLLALIWSAFGRTGGNKWWFGIHEDFCSFLLHSCPFMRLYGNVSFKLSKSPSASDLEGGAGLRESRNSQSAEDRFFAGSDYNVSAKVVTGYPGKHDIVVALTHIDAPD